MTITNINLSGKEYSLSTFQFATKLRTAMLLLILGISFSSASQLDSIHWMPPLTSADFGSSAGTYEHSVYLSTQETTAFDVTVTTGTGTFVGTYSVSNASPIKFALANGSNYLMMAADSVGTVQMDDGLILTASKKFYANYRIRSGAQGGSLTAKGQIAKGQEFYWGGVPNSGNLTKMNGVMGIMATSDNTTVTIDGYDPDCVFRQGTANNAITSNSITVVLDEGETYVIECVNTVVTDNADGWLGAHVISDKDIVMSNGNTMGGVITGSGSRDICIDQTLPIERLGTEHVTLRGNGIDNTELVVVVGVQNGTDISINGAAPVTTINSGDYYVINGSNYSAQSNMYIETSNPAYIYQVLAGSTNDKTIGLNFIPPLSCLLPVSVDNISDIDKINTTSYTGAVTILTRTGATVLVNGGPPVSAAQVVTGTSDWVTYLETGLTGDVSIVSDEPMAAGMFGANSNAGFAGYFSGFSERPTAEITANDTCVAAELTLLNTGVSNQWYFNGAELTGDTLQLYSATQEGSYYAIIGSGTCRDTSNTIVFDCNILPIELAYFRTECDDKEPTLKWETTSENNNDYFTIWSSLDGENFEMLEHIYGQGTSIQSVEYEYSLGRINGTNYYKLSQTDLDGQREFFNTVSVSPCDGSQIHIQIDKDYIYLMKDNVLEARIYDQMGRIIFQSEGDFNLIDLSSVKSGVHTLIIIYADGTSYFQRFFKSNY